MPEVYRTAEAGTVEIERTDGVRVGLIDFPCWQGVGCRRSRRA